MYFVVGPHRSGTSAVSQVIHLLGGGVGPDDDLIPASESNPAGHWESRSLVQVNDELLRRAGGSWDAPPFLDDGWEEGDDLGPTREHARRLVDRLFDDQAPASFKDPRSSLLLPFWRTVTEVEGCVVVLRDPQAVAASLGARNGLSTEAGAWLWLVYAVKAWRHAHPRTIVHYEELISDPASVASRLGEFLGLASPDAKTLDLVRASIRPGASRASPGGDSQADRWMRLAKATHRMMASEPDQAGSVVDAIHEGWVSERRRVEAAQALERSTIANERARAQDERIRAQMEDRISLLEREVAVRDDALTLARGQAASWASSANRIERSRTWRIGHFCTRALRVLAFRRPVRSHGPGELAATIKRALRGGPWDAVDPTPAPTRAPTKPIAIER